MPDGRGAERDARQPTVNLHERAAAARAAGEVARRRSERASDRARIKRVQNMLLATGYRRLRERRLI